MIKISAVIPCYNHGKTLHQAIDSILKQTVKVDEIIVVDDGSTDKHTREIINSLENRTARVILLENSGPSIARNKGISESQCEYVLLCDADDYYSPFFIEKALLFFQNDNLVAGVTCYQRLFGKSHGISKTSGGELKDFLSFNRAGTNMLLKKSVWQETGGFDESMTQGYEDWEFWIRVTKSGYKIASIPEALYSYRIQKKSHNHNAMNKHLENYKIIIDKHIESYRENALEVILEKEGEIQKLSSFWIYSFGFKLYNKFKGFFDFFRPRAK